MSGLLSLPGLIYAILGIAAIVGSVLVLRRNSTKATNEAMEQLNATLKDEIDALRRRIDDLEKERATQDRVIATIRYALRQYDLRIMISGDFVTINDARGKSKSVHIQDRAPVSPLTPGDDDSDAS